MSRLVETPPPDEVVAHVETILSSQTFLASDDPKLILPYIIERKLKDLAVTGMDIAVDVFRNHDHASYVRAKTARKNLKKKLLQYYRNEGKAEPVRIVFDKRGFLPNLYGRHSTPRVSIARALHANADAIRYRVNEFGFVMAAIPGRMAARQRPIDTERRRKIFKEVFDPAFRELRAVHTDYLYIFHAAQTSIGTRVDPAVVNAILEEISQRRIAFEAVRLELQFLFSQLSEEKWEPHASRFVELSLDYVRPPSKGTRAFTLMEALRACGVEALHDDAYQLATQMRSAIADEITDLRALMRLITKEFTSLRLATW